MGMSICHRLPIRLNTEDHERERCLSSTGVEFTALALQHGLIELSRSPWMRRRGNPLWLSSGRGQARGPAPTVKGDNDASRDYFGYA